MTQNNQFTRVAIHDSNWRIEVVEFNQNEANLTMAYPRWFINLLVDQDARGFKIEFHSLLRQWFLRNPFGPDFLLEEGTYVAKNHDGMMFVIDRFTLERAYRLWDESDG